jgi:arylsulfatase A-like enzyme
LSVRSPLFLIVLDATRADHLSCLGGPEGLTPNLDALAGQSHLYRKAWSGTTWTLPSIATHFTGCLPSRHGTSRLHPSLDSPLPTLAEQLRAGGYETTAISGNVWVSPATRFHRGFDRFDKVWQLVQDAPDVFSERMVGLFARDGFRASDLLRTVMSGNPVTNAINTLYGKFVCPRGDSGASRINQLVEKRLASRDRSRPPFLFLHYLEPHAPFHPPQPWLGKHLPAGITEERALALAPDPWAVAAGAEILTDEQREAHAALYRAEIAYLDHRLGELFRSLRRHRLYDDATIVVTADHGENLGDHGLLDHQYSVHETLLHVPLIVKEPKQKAGVTHDALVQSFDAFATLVEAAGLQDGYASERDSHPLPLTHDDGRTHAFAEYPEPQPKVEILRDRYPGASVDHLDRSLRAVRDTNFKLTESYRGDLTLHDLSVDPGEHHDLSREMPDRVTELRTALNDVLRGTPGAGADPGANPGDGPGVEDLDRELRERLEALGYLT